MGNGDPLAQYLTSIDRAGSISPTSATGDSARVEALLAELRVPWEPDPGGIWEWTITADIGEVNVRIEPESQSLLLFQGVGRVTGKAKAHADSMHLLMRLNSASTGACFAIEMENDREGYFILISRLSVTLLSRESLAHALESFFRTSKLIDELS